MNKNDELCELRHNIVHRPLWQTRVGSFEGVAKAFCMRAADELAIVVRDYRKEMGDLMDAEFTSILALMREWLELEKQSVAQQHNLRDDVLQSFCSMTWRDGARYRITGATNTQSVERECNCR